MAQGMNVCHMIGHLGDHSILRHTQAGTPVLSFRAACGERYRKSDGVWDEHVEWVNFVLFGKRAEGLSERLKKGTRVQVTGSLRQRSYTAQDGTERQVAEIRVSDLNPLSTPKGQQIRDEVVPSDDDFTEE